MLGGHFRPPNVRTSACDMAATKEPFRSFPASRAFAAVSSRQTLTGRRLARCFATLVICGFFMVTCYSGFMSPSSPAALGSSQITCQAAPPIRTRRPREADKAPVRSGRPGTPPSPVRCFDWTEPPAQALRYSGLARVACGGCAGRSGGALCCAGGLAHMARMRSSKASSSSLNSRTAAASSAI